MKILGVIPSRYASTRLPGKPLVRIGNKTMIQRVYEQVKQCIHLDQVVVATDHPEIAKEVESFGGVVCMTDPAHPTGTDRCYEAFTKQEMKFDYIINIQGDEPFIQPEQIDTLVQLLNGKTEIATLVKVIENEEDLLSAHAVKVVLTDTHKALYFSRAVIPRLRNVHKANWFQSHSFYKHIGMYAFRSDILKDVTQLPMSSLEKAESLEQLRWLENGYSIQVALTTIESLCIDTPEDLARAEKLIQS